MVWQVVSVAALVLGAGALVFATVAIRRLGDRDPGVIPLRVRRLLRIADPHPDDLVSLPRMRPGRERVAFVVNPIKTGLSPLREAAYRACSARHLPEPIWVYTSVEDPGTDAARRAISAGAEVLIAAGGDGTVRAVAAAASESGIPMGIVPLGTGNLLARNLDLPLRDTEAALRVALDGDDSRADIGWLTITRQSGASAEYPFLVIAGLGFDAEMVAGAKHSLKAKIGWMAYFIAALRHVGAKRMRATVRIDDRESVDKRMRTVLIANCGRLPGGVVLVPDARVDDGALDVAILDARGGIAGWTELAGQVVLQGTRITAPTLPDAWRVGRIDHVRGTSVEILTETPQRIQVDGESLGRALRVVARIEPGVVRIRSIVHPHKRLRGHTPPESSAPNRRRPPASAAPRP